MRTLCFVFLLLLPYLGFGQTINYPEGSYKKGEVIVKFKTNPNFARGLGKHLVSDHSKISSVLEKYGAFESELLMPESAARNSRRAAKYVDNINDDVDLSNLYLIKMDSTKSVLSAVEELNLYKDDIEYAEPNFIVQIQVVDNPNLYKDEPLYSSQWGLNAINMPKLWEVPVISAKRPIIAILDTGVDIYHPDLADNIWSNESEINGYDWKDDDNNGFRNDFHGWDFINNCSPERDNNGHGTHCAGIAAAIGNNGIGIVGANPNAIIMPVTVMQSNGHGDAATIVKGINYAVANGADIISMSIGHHFASLAESEALKRASRTAIVVAAAGNEGIEIEDRISPEVPSFPAAYSFVLGVQSIDSSGKRSSFSNYDANGPWYSNYPDEEGYNYELIAPGSKILSTYPGGTYTVLSGTSMACPLAAGAISRLLQVKEYDRRDLLWVDLLHTQRNCMNIFDAYQLSSSSVKPLLDITNIRIDDSLGDNDKHPDAGEEILLYPTIKNFRGHAENIRLTVSTDDEDIEIIQNDVVFGPSLDEYGSAVTQTPIRLRISPDCKDGKKVSLTIRATCDRLDVASEKVLFWEIDNGIELGGEQRTDITLYPEHHYIVTSNWAIARGVTVTVMPGTVIRIKRNIEIKCDGIFNAIGTKDNFIVITNTEDIINSEDASAYSFNGMLIAEGKFEYVKFTDLKLFWTKYAICGMKSKKLLLDNCIFHKVCHKADTSPLYLNACTIIGNCTLSNSLITECKGGIMNKVPLYNDPAEPYGNVHNNIINNVIGRSQERLNLFSNSNIFSNYNNAGNEANWFFVSNGAAITEISPLYLGTSSIETAHSVVRDLNNPDEGLYNGNTLHQTVTAGIIDLKKLLFEPDRESHGMVWKVLVNGYDARDEYDEMPQLGIGTHKFDIYFNRPMDKNFPPVVSMGPIEPFTQIPINEQGTWNDDGTIYSVNLTIEGNLGTDGENRIYVRGAQDFDHFPIPEERHRYNVMIQSMGSLNTNLIAEAGCGNIRLSWITDEEDMPDLMGYDIYRYTVDEWGGGSDPVKVNNRLLPPDYTSYSDFDVTVGETYYYYVVQVSTQFEQRLFSNTVSCRANTGLKGDANANSAVDVADIITEVSYILNGNPSPFLYEAADVNSDGSVNVLDVIGTINIIMNPSGINATDEEIQATYTVENGILYIDSQVPLGGVQVLLKGDKDSKYELMDALNNMEQATSWIDDNHYMLIAYSMSGRSIPAGKLAIMRVSDSTVEKVVLSDINGRNITVNEGTSMSIAEIDNDSYMDGSSSQNIVGIYDLSGRKIDKISRPGCYILSMKKNDKIVKTIILKK